MKWGNAAFGIVVNHKLLADLRAALGAAAPVEIDVATMGVNVSIFHRSAPYRPWDGGGPFRIFSCGRLNPCKGHGDLIQAVSLLRDKVVDAHLEIAGADDSPGHSQPMLEKLEKQIDVLNLKDRVVLLGTVSEQVVLEGLEKSHVFALASLNEPRSVAIMEAMAMGTPVVATRSGGTAETVDDGVDGILVEPLNPTDVAKGLELVARDGNLATRLASAGREKIVRSYQSDQNARNILRHLEN
jgi:glycosyltransferase involved in cell wall biosynthesis